MLGGCSAYQSAVSTVDWGYNTAILWPEYRGAIKTYERAEANQSRAQFALAATRFENLIDRHPESRRREAMTYNLARAHLQLRNYHDAEIILNEYLERYPSGEFAARAEQDKMRIAAESDPDRAGEEYLKKAENDLAMLAELEAEHPTDPQIKFLLGNLYYELEQYETAATKYFEAQSLEAAYTERELISKRLYIDENGKPAVLTPSVTRRLDRDKNPVVLFDVFDYTQRSNSDFGARQRFAVITGKVRNQGSTALRHVEIEIRFLNAVNDILDVEFVPIGPLAPDEIRAFRTRATHYDTLYNITKVETYALIDR